MKKIFNYTVTQPILVNVLTILIVISGFMALSNLNRDIFPNIQLDVVMINTVYPGATPKEIEKLITIPIEKELKEVNDIKEMSSASNEGISSISIEIDPNAPNKRKVITDIQRAVDRVDDLPDDLKRKPLVTEIETRNRPVVEISLSGDVSFDEIISHARDLETLILDLPDIASIKRKGWRNSEIWVEVKPEAVSKYYLSLSDIVMALKKQNISIPGGTLVSGGKESILRTSGEFYTADQVGETILRANDNGYWVRLSDIASVKKTFEPEIIKLRSNGKLAVNLVCIKKETGDVISLVKSIQNVVDNYKGMGNSNIDITLVNDYSYYVKRRLNVLVNNGWIGIVLVLICLFLFLNARVAIATALGIPMAFLITFFIMWYSGLTINLVTMFGLILVLGMIVDDAIIISENVHRHIEEGMHPIKAAINGTFDVWKPVLTTVITTIAAFAPLMFMSGVLGKFVMYIPLVVILALLASLFEAFIMLPSHLVSISCIPKLFNRSPEKKGIFARLFDRSIVIYVKWLHKLLYQRKKVAIISSLFFIGSLYIGFAQLPFVLFPQKGIDAFFIRAKAPIGTSLNKMSELMSPLEHAMLSIPKSEWNDFITEIGRTQNDDIDPLSKQVSHVGQISVFLKSSSTRSMSADSIVSRLRELTSDIQGLEEVSFEKVRQGPPVGKPIYIRVRGDELDKINAVVSKVKMYLAQIPGVSDVEDSHELGKDEIRIDVDEKIASEVGLHVSDIALAVRSAFDGIVATTIKQSDDEIDIRVRYPDELRYQEGALEKVRIPNGKGKLIPLSSVANLKRAQGINGIYHYDRKRTTIITAMVDEVNATSVSVTQNIQNVFSNIGASHPGISINFGGEWEKTQESLISLQIAMVIAVMVIFLVMALQFQSLLQPAIVLFSIIYGFVGIVWAFLFHMEPKSFLSLVGAVGLAGVVVNNSIVLIDFINKAKLRGKNTFDAILEAASIRLRPIVLTTITTVVGLLPVAYGLMGSDPFLEPMALAIGWGLLFATACTLIVTPCIYAVVEDCRNRISQIFNR